VVTEVGGEAVGTVAELRASVSAKQPGERVELQLRRDGETRTVEVELGARPASVQ
jgi:S1-C subfamily serine protease